MAIRAIATSDTKSEQIGSYARNGVQIGGIQFCHWIGIVNVLAGTNAASLDVIISSEQRGLPDTIGLIIDANSAIQSIGIHPQGDLILGSATGKLKFATALNAANSALYVESAAAVGGTLVKPLLPVIQRNIVPASIGANDVIYKLFATDGGAGAAATASTVTATKDTKIIICIDFINFTPFPLNTEVPPITPKI